MNGVRARAERGMTLVETLVVLSIISLTLSVVAVSLTDIFGARLSEGTGKVSAVCRYGYDQASLKGKMYRMVVDFGARSFWLEEVEMPKDCGMTPDSMDPDAEKKPAKVLKEEEEAGPELGTGKAAEDMRVKKETLPDGISFAGLLTNRHTEMVTEGTDYVYFFPDGTAEKAFLWVTDGEEYWTVEVKALQGTGIVHKENLAAEEFRKK